MPSITNKTKKPLRVGLPGGKTLHLGPGRSGQITAAAAEHPPVVKLVEAGELELQRDDRRPVGDKGASGPPTMTGQNPNVSGGIRHTGDR
jgi:hypothetical protein